MAKDHQTLAIAAILMAVALGLCYDARTNYIRAARDERTDTGVCMHALVSMTRACESLATVNAGQEALLRQVTETVNANDKVWRATRGFEQGGRGRGGREGIGGE